MADRRALSEQFLQRAGWDKAERRFLAGDASDRSYDRLRLGQRSAVLMDAPPGKGEDPAVFLRVADFLRRLGLSAPEVLAEDLTNGFLLLEDLGDGLLARLAATEPAREVPLYAAAVDVLLHLQSAAPLPGLLNMTAAEWAKAAAFSISWYRFAATGDQADDSAFVTCLTEVLHRHADEPRVVILRDYHAENLLWLPERQGVARVGVLDFQTAQMGQRGYDLVSLLQDARRDIGPETRLIAERQFIDATDQTASAFGASFAVLGAQRALRILGIFARLCLVSGKTGYLPMLPRVWGHLTENLQHPALADLAKLCELLLPPPSKTIISRIEEQCARFR